MRTSSSCRSGRRRHPTWALPAALWLNEETDIEAAAKENAERSRQLQRRARQLRQQFQTRKDLVKLVEAEETPLMVELISANMSTLETAGAYG